MQAGANDNLDVISKDACLLTSNGTTRYIGPGETLPYKTKWGCPGADGVYSSHGGEESSDCWKVAQLVWVHGW